MDLNRIKTVYFLGIGGIGMSALAGYFLQRNCKVYGYDLTPTGITDKLIREGAVIHFKEDVNFIPEYTDIVIHTPAVPKTHSEYRFFEDHGIPVYKRAEVLGWITGEHNTIAVAGTHGKTTTSALITHILYPEINITAFIGGILKNTGTNFIAGQKESMMVAEADEYDRSFLQLHPTTAIITSMDADHLDIYREKHVLENSFRQFATQIRNNGALIIHENIAGKIEHPNKITYGFDKNSDYFATDIELFPDKTVFTLHHHEEVFRNITIGIPGEYNLLNGLAAIAALREQFKGKGVPGYDFIFHKLASFEGVKRRFDYRIYRDDLVYIDDYAHHPKEISSVIDAVKAAFPNKKITGIFQPHLYSRTKDFGTEFARSLEKLDRIILLDIYPAREEPIPGISSEWLLDLIRNHDKILLPFDEVLPFLENHAPEVLLTIGAGNIDKLVPVLENGLNRE